MLTITCSAAAVGVSTMLATPAASAGPRTPIVPIIPITTNTPALAPIPPALLAQQMQAAILTAVPGTQVGIDVVDTTTGRELAELNPEQQFYTASVVKLLIALDMLNGQGWQPDSAGAAQIQQMLSASDDDIADALWDADGGDAIVTRMSELIGLTGTEPPDNSAQWGETRTTARDVVRIYRYLAGTVPEASRTVIMDALRDVSEIAADGTDQYFGIPAALPEADWAVKPGWMSLDASTTLNSTGLVGTSAARPLRYAVVVLTTQPADIAWSTGGSAITAGIAVLETLIGD
jgi:hypothetical protein